MSISFSVVIPSARSNAYRWPLVIAFAVKLVSRDYIFIAKLDTASFVCLLYVPPLWAVDHLVLAVRQENPLTQGTRVVLLTLNRPDGTAT
jgi:hypothetical protein